MMQLRDPEYPQPYVMTGNSLAILSNRASYGFDLKGPSMTLDTACSNSLYALHLACSSIQNRDCGAAIVAGANLILTPETQLLSSGLDAISASGRCHTFDSRAGGYSRAEGVSAFFIKRFDALRCGNPIRAVIRNTAVNSNGKTGGITRPSSSGQETVMRKAYEQAALDFSVISYLECYCTGIKPGTRSRLEPLAVSLAALGARKTHSLLDR
ncbi:MAG: hypothetical protein Q9182_005755 [Xanthomendoza sp. 2 TL-2023]